MAKQPAACAVRGCSKRGLVQQRVPADFDPRSTWMNLTLCGIHFVECDRMGVEAFLERHCIDAVEHAAPWSPI